MITESKFLTELKIALISEASGTWKLDDKLEYQSKIFKDLITVPSGFVTDFASVPRVPIAYYLAGNTAHAAAVVHDYLYQTHIVSKFKSDRIFLEAMVVTEIPKWRRQVMYYAVVFFGWSSWRTGKKRFLILGNI